MARLCHVTSALNRGSILAHGLDWTRMGAAPGIAGSLVPEKEGVFLCRDEFEADFFVRINNTGTVSRDPRTDERQDDARSGPDRGRDGDGVARHQRSHRDVRPAEAVEVQEDML